MPMPMWALLPSDGSLTPAASAASAATRSRSTASMLYSASSLSPRTMCWPARKDSAIERQPASPSRSAAASMRLLAASAAR